jgi:hypothetical protein
MVPVPVSANRLRDQTVKLEYRSISRAGTVTGARGT